MHHEVLTQKPGVVSTGWLFRDFWKNAPYCLPTLDWLANLPRKAAGCNVAQRRKTSKHILAGVHILPQGSSDMNYISPRPVCPWAPGAVWDNAPVCWWLRSQSQGSGGESLCIQRVFREKLPCWYLLDKK